MENVVLKATAKDPNDRYPTVERLADDLNTSLDRSRANESKFVVPNHHPDLNEATRVMPFSPLSDEKVAADQVEKRTGPTNAATKNPKKKPPDRKKKRRRRIIIAAIFGLLVLVVAFILVATASGKTVRLKMKRPEKFRLPIYKLVRSGITAVIKSTATASFLLIQRKIPKLKRIPKYRWL
jgi:serine/threonine-protein kinase